MADTLSLGPRAAAMDLIAGVLEGRRSLSEVIVRPPDSFAALPPEGRARAQRLATETFRHMGRADHHLRHALCKAPPEPVIWVLRMAVTEMHVLGAPAHGVINDAVDLTRRAGQPWLDGLVNAVLRRLSDGLDWASAPVPRLPGWLRGALQNAYGAKGTAAIEAAHLTPAPLDLTLRDARPEGLEGDMLPTGSLRLRDPGQISKLPGYEAGQWWVQDAAAALPARLLGDVAGLRVLDLCAAPGGKTMQLAAQGAAVTALDISAARMVRLRENLSRTGLQAETIVADALEWRPETPFDAILLDAPCSATGTLRRHPELPLIRSKDDVKALQALQAALLDRVLDPTHGLLRPGGRVVFCTCSLLPAEGSDQIVGALARHSAMIVPPMLSGLPEEWLLPDGCLRTRPDYWADLGGLDGFFIAVLQHMP
ncbi:transcription antitermination factor NusB [Roseinatronobacter sp.]|uniref:RsmB/NOP family class I SAM-dependent RNA methyltransferase n=1 Tax=Roseinatronobacter sp. TaxID=1945755 RepID=UPI0025DA511F|nr:transcription antitermination factor NusB [Rhodobaca sp.]